MSATACVRDLNEIEPIKLYVIETYRLGTTYALVVFFPISENETILCPGL